MVKRLDIADFLKGWSIFTIVVMHLVQYYPLSSALMKATAFGGAGVHVFLLCSGFGLYLSYLNKPLTYGMFLKRRFGRIYWPMAVVCILTACWMLFNGKDIIMPLISNLLLFKMFIPELENSMGQQMWFISTIIQFYLAWPLIVWLIRLRGGAGFWISLVISLAWSTLVGLLGFSEERVWNSFFLQYLWEFCLGMKLAELYFRHPEKIQVPKWKYLLPACALGMALTGIMGWMGFPWKLYNDIPSLVGYTSLALIIYKLGIPLVNRFMCYTNGFSYEWYLVHGLVFSITRWILKDSVHVSVEILLCFALSYLAAMGYEELWTYQRKRSGMNKNTKVCKTE